MILYAILYGFLGSKLTYVLLNWSAFMKNPSSYISNGWVCEVLGISGTWTKCVHRCMCVCLDPHITVYLKLCPLGEHCECWGTWLCACTVVCACAMGAGEQKWTRRAGSGRTEVLVTEIGSSGR